MGSVIQLKKQINNSYLDLKDFFAAVPFTIDLEIVDKEQWAEFEEQAQDVYPSVLKYIGGYTKVVKDDNDLSYIKVFIQFRLPDGD